MFIYIELHVIFGQRNVSISTFLTRKPHAPVTHLVSALRRNGVHLV